MSVTGGQYVVAKPIQDLIEKHIYDGVGNAMQIWRQMQKEQPPPVQVPNWPPSITQVKKVWQAQQIQQTLDTGPRAPARKRTDYDKTVSKCVGCSVQGDLAQMTKIELFNKLKEEGGVGQWDVVEKWPASWSPDAAGYTVPPNATSNIVKNLGRYVLTFIDIRSRYVHAIILRSKDENEVLRGIKALVERMKAQGNPIKNLNFDEERAVNSRLLHNYLHHEDITLWLSGPRRGKPTQFVVERFIRTFRTRLRLYLRTRQTKRWVDIFPKVIESYNNAHHSSLGGPPAEFYESNDIPEYMEFNAWQSPLTKFKPGDIVRVRKPPDIFDKRSDVKYWTKNLYRVVGLAPYDREVDKFPAEAPDKQVPPGVSRRFKLVKDPNPKGDPPIERRWYDMVLVDKKNVRVYEPKQPGTKALGQAVKTMTAQRRQPQSAVSQPETILNTRTRQNRTINPRVAAALGKNKKLLSQGGKGMSCPKGKAKCDCDLPVVDLSPKTQRGRGRPKGTGNRHFGAYDAYEEHGEEGGAILERLSQGAQGKSLAVLRQRWKALSKDEKDTLRSAHPTAIKSAVKLSEALAAMRHGPQHGGAVVSASGRNPMVIASTHGSSRGQATKSVSQFRVPRTIQTQEQLMQGAVGKELGKQATVSRSMKAIQGAMRTVAHKFIPFISKELGLGTETLSSMDPTMLAALLVTASLESSKAAQKAMAKKVLDGATVSKAAVAAKVPSTKVKAAAATLDSFLDHGKLPNNMSPAGGQPCALGRNADGSCIMPVKTVRGREFQSTNPTSSPYDDPNRKKTIRGREYENLLRSPAGKSREQKAKGAKDLIAATLAKRQLEGRRGPPTNAPTLEKNMSLFPGGAELHKAFVAQPTKGGRQGGGFGSGFDDDSDEEGGAFSDYIPTGPQAVKAAKLAQMVATPLGAWKTANAVVGALTGRKHDNDPTMTAEEKLDRQDERVGRKEGQLVQFIKWSQIDNYSEWIPDGVEWLLPLGIGAYYFAVDPKGTMLGLANSADGTLTKSKAAIGKILMEVPGIQRIYHAVMGQPDLTGAASVGPAYRHLSSQLGLPDQGEPDNLDGYGFGQEGGFIGGLLSMGASALASTLAQQLSKKAVCDLTKELLGKFCDDGVPAIDLVKLAGRSAMHKLETGTKAAAEKEIKKLLKKLEQAQSYIQSQPAKKVARLM